MIFLKITFYLLQSLRVGSINVEQCHSAVNFDSFLESMLMNFQQDTEIVETFIHMLSSYLHTELIFADTAQNANSGRV